MLKKINEYGKFFAHKYEAFFKASYINIKYINKY